MHTTEWEKDILRLVFTSLGFFLSLVAPKLTMVEFLHGSRNLQQPFTVGKRNMNLQSMPYNVNVNKKKEGNKIRKTHVQYKFTPQSINSKK